MVLKKLEVRRILPEYLVVGESTPIQFEFTNCKRFWPSLSVTVSELNAADVFRNQPQGYLLHVAAKMTAMVPTQITPMRRGLHRLDRYQLSTGFPFGFVKRAIERHREETILVYPPLGEVDRRLLSLCISAEQSGARMKPRCGGSDEFYGVKEYRQGENPRWIYWRRSARTGTLVSKEMTQIAPPRMLIFLDTFLENTSRESRAFVECTIAMAASLISRTIDQGLAVGLVAWSDGWINVPPMRGKQHTHELLTQLARLTRNSIFDRHALTANGHHLIETGVTPVLMTPTDMEQSLLEQARSNWIVVAASTSQARAWFKFRPEVNFEQYVSAEDSGMD